MNIDSNNDLSRIYAQNLAKQNPTISAKQSGAANGSAAQAGDRLELNALDRLRQEPEIRPEVVAKGKELLNDPDFPSKEMIDSIAKLIVPFADEE